MNQSILAILVSSSIGGIGGLLALIFAIWMLVDCIKNEKDGTQRLIWALVIFFLPCIGSLIYFFARKLSRGKG